MVEIISNDEIKEKYLKAGEIASSIREDCKKINPGEKLIDIAENIENKIKSLGAEIAFPVNLSLNEIAAHYTPYNGDSITVEDGDLLKIDIGAHIDGCVADTAITLCFNEDHKNLVAATDKALSEAIKICKPGTTIGDLSEVIENSIKEFDCIPVGNLTGHGLDRFIIHDEPQIPNIKVSSNYELKDNMVIAIEPFATNGKGLVKDSGSSLIFSFLQRKPVRSPEARKIIAFAEPFKQLPFAERWVPIDSRIKIRFAIKELLSRGIIHEYPPLKEVGSGMVAQSEHTIIVKDTPIITTK
ncbi:type II methionyl aminopeptidase [Candidatus Aenigmatarchaeota archaeon]